MGGELKTHPSSGVELLINFANFVVFYVEMVNSEMPEAVREGI